MTTQVHMHGSKKRGLRMFLSIAPPALLMNYLMFGSRYFTELPVFLIATVALIVVGTAMDTFYASLMKIIRSRFPGENQFTIRIVLALVTFIIFSGLALFGLFALFTKFRFLGFNPSDGTFGQCYSVLIIINTFLMFVHESMANFDNYMVNVKATEALKKEYLESQLIGLKSQLNPHFLFNSLNTLSCLIQEETDDAEVFLDHMSKVFRYLLRNNDEKEVPLLDEIKFIQSYCYLLKARHKEALDIKIDVEEEYLQATIPPLTLQMIIENITTHNTIARNQPLYISVHTWNNHLLITNNNQPKQANDGVDTKSIKNIINKFRLLWSAEVAITETVTERQVCIPLIHQTVPQL